MGGQFARGGNVAAISRKPGLIELFGRGMDNHMWQNYRDPGTGNWSGWFALEDGGDLTGDPAVASMSSDHVQLFALGTDDQLWSKWWVDS